METSKLGLTLQLCRTEDLPAGESCGSDERKPLLAHVVVVMPPPQQPAPTVGLVVSSPWSGLTAKELMALAADPFWVRARRIALYSFWVFWFTLLVAAMAVVLTSPRCGKPGCSTANNSSELLGDITGSSLSVSSITPSQLDYW